MFNLVFLLAALSLVWGLRLQSNPESAKKGNFLASMGMGLAIPASITADWSCQLLKFIPEKQLKQQSPSLIQASGVVPKLRNFMSRVNHSRLQGHHWN